MKPTQLSLQLPTGDFTAGDIAGKSLRIARLNWRSLFRLFFMPLLVLNCAIDLVFYVTEKDSIPMPIVFGCIAAGLLLSFFAMWELALRKLALLESITEKKHQLDDCLSTARKQRGKILLIVLPLIIFELLLDLAMVLALLVVKGAGGSGGSSREADMTLGLILMIATLIASFPFFICYSYNTFCLAIYSYEKKSIWQTCVRSAELIGKEKNLSWLFAFLVMILFSFQFITGSIEFIFMPLPEGILRDILMNITSLACNTPLLTLLTASTVIGSAMLYEQICARNDGSDLLDKLNYLNLEQQV